MDTAYKRIHIVINPASGHDEPVLNIINRVFGRYDIEWSVSITHKYGDATEQARRAIERGVDLVAGYGGDGTQHEVANAVLTANTALNTDAVMGILPGGTGNGFAREMGIPKSLEEAVEALCTSQKTRKIDVGKAGDEFFIQRLYVGIEPEEQTSREMKDKYGVLAYAISLKQQMAATNEVDYQVEIDGQSDVFRAAKLYVVNSGMMGTGLSITHTYAVDDGLLDAFVLSTENLNTLKSAIQRFFHIDNASANFGFRQCKRISIDTDPDQPVWADGEHIGRTPISIEVLPGALTIVVPE